MPEKRGSKDARESGLVTLARYSHLGFVLPAAAFAGWLIGTGLDHLFHRTWINLAGLAIGVIAGFYDLIRAVLALGKEPADDDGGTGSGGDVSA